MGSFLITYLRLSKKTRLLVYVNKAPGLFLDTEFADLVLQFLREVFERNR